MLKNRSLSPEERETIILLRERYKELELHKTVERGIVLRENDSGQTEYFCKWNGISYDNCRWEQQVAVQPICVLGGTSSGVTYAPIFAASSAALRHSQSASRLGLSCGENVARNGGMYL